MNHKLGLAMVFLGIISFQNCSPVQFSLTPTVDLSSQTDDSCVKNPASCVPTPQTCHFNGETYQQGETVTAFLYSSVPVDKTCRSEVRTCINGSFTGSYPFASCEVGAPASCLFNGRTVASGASIKAYQNSSVAYGQTCASENRVCTNGVLSGSYNFAECSAGAAASCLFNGQTVAHGVSVVAYQSSSVAYGQLCASQTRVCTNGALTGSYAFASCDSGAPGSCLFNGQSVAHGQTVTAYQNSTVPYGQNCASQSRLCTNGVLSGTYSYGSCTAGGAASCLFNGQTITHGQEVTAYQSSTVGFGQSCASQRRVCTNGSLSGSYNYDSCNVNSAASCLFNGVTVAHGGSVTAYQASTVGYGKNCTSQTRVCNNGVLNGTYTYSTCTPGAPASCNFNGQTIAHGENVVAYSSSSVAYGQSCAQQTRTCNNGALSGTYAYHTCFVRDPVACTFNGQTVAHGGSVYAYATSSVPDGQVCQGQTRYCSNGVLSGSYSQRTCTVLPPAPSYASCSLGGQTISHGGTITAYQSSSVGYGQACAPETRVCNNGSLSGSYTALSCTAAGPASCPGGTLPASWGTTPFPAVSYPALASGQQTVIVRGTGSNPAGCGVWQQDTVTIRCENGSVSMSTSSQTGGAYDCGAN